MIYAPPFDDGGAIMIVSYWPSETLVAGLGLEGTSANKNTVESEVVLPTLFLAIILIEYICPTV